MGKEYGNRFFGRCARERAGHIVTPELQAHSTDCRSGDSVGDARRFDVECAEGKVGGLSGGRDEGEKSVGGGVKLPMIGRSQYLLSCERSCNILLEQA